jgi:hypothetical protein
MEWEEGNISILVKIDLWAIIITRDNQRGGGGKTKSHMKFFSVLNSDFKAFGGKSHVRERKIRLIYNLFHTSKLKSLKTVIIEWVCV